MKNRLFKPLNYLSILFLIFLGILSSKKVAFSATLKEQNSPITRNIDLQALQSWIWDGTEPTPSVNEVTFGTKNTPWTIYLKTTLTANGKLTIEVEARHQSSGEVSQGELIEIDPTQDRKSHLSPSKKGQRLTIEYQYLGNAKGEIRVLAIRPWVPKK